MDVLLDEAEDGVERLAAIVDAFADRQRRIAALQAEQARLLSEAHDYATARIAPSSLADPRPRDIRAVAAEIAAATRLSDRSVQARMADASTLVTRFPLTHRAPAEGGIDRAHADVIVDSGIRISDDDARERFEIAVIAVAERETAGRLRPIARLLADRIHEVPLEERHRDASRRRRVWVRDQDDGMAEFGGSFPAVTAHAMFDRATRIAQSVVEARHAAEAEATLDGLELPSARDARTFEEVRADAVADLLLTGHATPEASGSSVPASEAIRARVQITVPALSLVGGSGEPAQLVGHGPIPLDAARRLAASVPGWDRVLTHPVTGCVVAVDRYRPSSELRRALAVRDEHCRFPGCRMPTWRCDADHTVDHAHGGATEYRNLAHLCRRHHMLKHYSAWRVRQRPDGVLEWTSPTGRVYEDVPARTLAFGPPDDPPF